MVKGGYKNTYVTVIVLLETASTGNTLVLMLSENRDKQMPWEDLGACDNPYSPTSH